MRSATTACDRALALAVVLVTTACEIATGGAFASAGIGAGASVGDDGESSSSSESDDELGKTDDGPDDLPKPGVEDETSGGDDDTSTGDATTTDAAETSTTAAESESESESSSGDASVEPWSACLGGGCGDGMVCMSVPMQEGLCTQACTPADDATSCPPAPGGLDTICISLQGSSWCALDCSFAECPVGTDCFVVADDHSAATICL
jgi:hypothetical protein